MPPSIQTDMSMFSHSTAFTINGGTFTAVATSPTRIGIDKLVKVANPNAMHDASARYDPPKCHPGTRKAILEHIMQWIFGSSNRDCLILWLYGPAGSGKSAILQSIAEKCAALDILLASFFFSRSDGTRDHPRSLVATIAYQISARIPQITTALDAAIVRNPLIFDKTLESQIDVLIVGPLRRLLKSGYFADRKSAPCLILIDGLDECNDEMQRRLVLQAISRTIRGYKLPFIFLISSRPEVDIRFTFNCGELADLWSSLVLDDFYKPNADILHFLADSFLSIKKTHPLKEHIPSTWPTTSSLKTLVTKSSGQFIYASTIVKYISTTHASPPQQLDIILGIRQPRPGDIPFAELDALYMHILSSVRETNLMLDVLALLMGHFDFSEQYSATNISWFLGVDQEEVDILFSSLVSIIVRDDYHYFCIAKSSIQISHASLIDFLADPRRSGRFYIDRTQYSAKFVRRGIKWLSSPESINLGIFDAVFTSPRPLQMDDELYRDLESLQLDFIWREIQGTSEYTSRWDRCWLHMFEWFLPKSKFLPASTSSHTDLGYQNLCVKHARQLKKLIKGDSRYQIKIKNFPALAETLAHDFVVNGMLYDETLTKFLLRKEISSCSLRPDPTISKDSLPCTIFRIIGLSRINEGENAHIHAALRILKSLETSPFSFCAKSSISHYCHFHHTQGWPTAENRHHLSGCSCQHRRLHINSGRISRIQRQMRLMRFRHEMRAPFLELFTRHEWNRKLIAHFLIPILNQCPKSDILLALIKQRIRKVFLKYTPRRHLMDAVSRYIRRISAVESK